VQASVHFGSTIDFIEQPGPTDFGDNFSFTATIALVSGAIQNPSP
jgi:hypothetical protein